MSAMTGDERATGGRRPARAAEGGGARTRGARRRARLQCGAALRHGRRLTRSPAARLHPSALRAPVSGEPSDTVTRVADLWCVPYSEEWRGSARCVLCGLRLARRRPGASGLWPAATVFGNPRVIVLSQWVLIQ